ncbi:MAG: tRNA (adenosine(37)-N6)-threonylcarbamoyltransferase complex ATPase subunit type 1 TsaE [Pseudoruegeria sp.]
MSQTQTSFFLADEHQATQLAQHLSPLLGVGDCLLLSGPVGAGKSHFARSIILSKLTEPEDVPSPTFTLVQTYETSETEIWHCDLYRLSDAEDALELGLDDAFDTALCLIEWPDRLGKYAPENALSLAFDHKPDGAGRTLIMSGATARWAHTLDQLNNE